MRTVEFAQTVARISRDGPHDRVIVIAPTASPHHAPQHHEIVNGLRLVAGHGTCHNLLVCYPGDFVERIRHGAECFAQAAAGTNVGDDPVLVTIIDDDRPGNRAVAAALSAFDAGVFVYGEYEIGHVWVLALRR